MGRNVMLHFRRIIVLIPISLFCIFFLYSDSFLLNGQRFFTSSDDATISLTYAKTFVQTGELVWYPGSPRVQGVTNPFYTLLMTLIELFHFSPNTNLLLINVMGAVFVCLTSLIVGIIVYHLVSSENNKLYLSSIAMLVTPLMHSFLMYPLRGLEVGFLGCNLLLSSLFLMKAYSKSEVQKKYLLISGIISSLSILTRFDFLIFVLISCLFVIKLQHPNKLKYSALTYYFIIPIISTIFLLIFQKMYWGSWLPNTYYLKIAGFEILERTPRGVSSALKVFPILGLAIFSQFYFLKLSSNDKFKRSVLNLLLYYFIGAVLYSIYVGGDSWDMSGLLNRYIAVALPAIVIVIIVGSQKLNFSKLSLIIFFCITLLTNFIYGFFWSGNSLLSFEFDQLKFLKLFSYSIFCILIIAVGMWLPSSYRSKLNILAISLLIIGYTSFGYWFQWIKQGESAFIAEDRNVLSWSIKLNEIALENASIAVAHAGLPAYLSRNEMVDLLGKNDSFISHLEPRGLIFPGHNKWNYEYSIGVLKPDLIAETWYMNDIDRENFTKWGYKKYCLNDYSFYVKLLSKELYWANIVPCE
jgi:arabinofuranosyltransferase